jgi:hypothetical protein
LAIKLGHFIVHALISFVTNTQTKQQKLENEENRRLVGLTPDLKVSKKKII